MEQPEPPSRADRAQIARARLAADAAARRSLAAGRRVTRLGGPVTRQTWTAIVSAVCFVTLALFISLLHVPFVSWAPGRTLDLLGTGSTGHPALQVNGTRTWPVTGQLRMTTVSVTRVDSALSLPEALLAHVLPDHDVLPREVVYPSSKSAAQVTTEEAAQMDTSKSDAVVAALREAGQSVAELPLVSAVGVSGPSYDKLQPGDLVERVDQSVVHAPADVTKLVQRHQVGDAVVFTVLRNGRTSDITITTSASNQDQHQPVIGVTITQGYRYSPTVGYGIDPDVVGPSAGLVFSLALYDRITAGDLMGGRIVAGTGTIDAKGAVGGIGGIQEKIAGAQKADASVFLVPAANCVDLAGVKTSMTLVKVASLDDAVKALTALKAGHTDQLPHC